MQLPLQDFTVLVRNQAAAVAQSCRTLVDMSVGSVLRSILEANAAVALWVQWLIVDVLATTRAATSQGADLDSWMADFGLARLAAVPATCVAHFSRATPGLATVIPVGAVIRTGVTADAQAFQVVADATRAEWTGAGFAMGASVTDLLVPITAVTAGRAGNVQAGVLTLLSTAIPGVDAVTNDVAATGGLDAETDAALRTRFGGFIDSRTRATEQAVSYAIQSVQQGLQFVILDRMDTQGVLRAGHFTAVVDDGTGTPSASLIASIGGAIEAVRPVGGSYSVRGPALTSVSVTMVAQGPVDALVAVQTAVAAFLQALPIGSGVVLSRLIQVAHDADARISRVGAVLVNGVAADLSVPVYGRVAPGLVTVTAP